MLPLYYAAPQVVHQFFQALRNSTSTRPIALYSVHANPANDFYICTAGKDSYVRIFDRRNVSNENPAPVKKLCPQHLVRL